MTIGRRTFLRTVASAIAVGFAKVETAVAARPGALTDAMFYGGGAGAGKTELMFHGIPFHMNDGITSHVWMGISRETIAAFEGASGDPTSDS